LLEKDLGTWAILLLLRAAEHPVQQFSQPNASTPAFQLLKIEEHFDVVKGVLLISECITLT
jgi:hypothetical protein